MPTYAFFRQYPIGRLRHSLVAIALSLSLAAVGSPAVAADLTRLTEAEIATQLTTLPGWTTDGDSLICIYQFNDFVEAVAFINRLVAPAEAAAHHPDLAITYNTVTLSLTTHDAGGLTQQDFDLAQAIAQISGEGTGEPQACL